MYKFKLEYLPVAQRDLVEIVRHISQELKNPDAAGRLAVQLTDAAEGLRLFPYGCPAYVPLRPLKHEYRKLVVQNYLMLYWVDDVKRVVTIARVIYGRRDLSRMLEKDENKNSVAIQQEK